MTLEEEVLSKIKPTEEEEEKLMEKAQIILERFRDLDAELEGSFRKGTWLKGASDIDIFVLYPKSVGEKYLKEKALKEMIERVKDLEYKIAYAEHPYLIVTVDGIDIDVVPALRIESGEEVITATDRTPLHSRYVLSHLDEKGKDEVRLLKRFMKGIGVYGAEIKVKGFSGYVAELLVIKHGSFRGVLESASKWKPPVRVELVKPKKEFQDPLIIPDPVDPRRNTASAVSLKSLATFSLASRMYLERPSIDFFFPTREVKAVADTDVLLVKIEVKEKVVEDLIWGQVWKSVERIKKYLEKEGYKVIDTIAWGDEKEIVVVIQLESREIGKYYLIRGPYFYLKEAVDGFIKTHEKVWVGEDGRLYAIEERKESVEDIVKKAIAISYRHYAEMMWIEKGKEVSGELAKFLAKTPSWLRE